MARWLAAEGRVQRADAERAARAALASEEEDSESDAPAPWRALLERAAQAGARAEDEVKEQLEQTLELEPRKARGGITREYDVQARRARRRAHTASLDRDLELVGLWFRDLATVAAGAEEQVFNSDRLESLRADAAGREGRRMLQCLELCEDTRRRLERNVFEDLALEALFNRLRRSAAIS